ncbi:cyclic nucleotide-binding domain-containing protein [Pontibacter ruber]|uniref:Cyclic nucleotide-binding domain-containing protein n=1 Tax=Pontibacter ruber TaxID=1343895 RepID=A0ABW5CUG7_9BACT|nr:cyclic nucleotide-binding domain-containing protein [Pontibacter ruber]
MMIRQLIDEGVVEGEREQREAGNCLFRAGDPLEAYYYLLSGSVCLTTAPLAAPQILKPNTLIGLQDLMHDTYSQTALLLADSEILRIKKEAFLQALQSHTSLRLHLIQQMSKQTTLTQASYE